MAAIFVDFDRLKQVNDALGHQVGDRLLISAAQRLSDSIRPQDSVARIGGDEFLVVCANLASASEALGLADRARRALTGNLRLRQLDVPLSVSIGVAAVRRRAAHRQRHIGSIDPDQQCRHRHVRGEEHRTRAQRALHRRNALGGTRACRAGLRAGSSDHRPTSHDRLPADVLDRHPSGDRRRGPGSLGTSRARLDRSEPRSSRSPRRPDRSRSSASSSSTRRSSRRDSGSSAASSATTSPST